MAPTALQRVRVIAAAIAGAAIAACAKAPVQPEPPPPVEVRLALSADAGLNPDSQGRPSPLTIRVYELADVGAFAAVDLLPLWDAEQSALGAALVARHEFRLGPAERATAVLELKPATRALGVAAAYRDFRQASWRAVVPVPPPAAGRKPINLKIATGASSVTAALD